MARYHAEGIHTVLVCCTGGEEGEVLNPALDTPEVHTRLAELRRQELAQAAEIIGYDEVVMLGYRDSGMAGSEANANPLSFAQASHDEAVGRVVEVVRRTRPQVMVIYGDDQSGYPHPDHLRVHEIGLAAFDAAADSALYPEIGPAWQVSKLYYTVFSVARFRQVHEKFLELGLESPFDEGWRKRWDGVASEPITASIDISDFADVRREALLAHATQVDPKSPFWFGLPPEVMRSIHPFDDYRLARVVPPSLIGGESTGASASDEEPVESDLFAGLRPHR